MPSIDENLRSWDDPDSWEEHGEEWSAAWGSTPAMWFGTILPRIAPFLPAGTLLEIACGHGRVTEYLVRHCRRLVGVDLAPSCVEACRRRFASRPEAAFLLTDGRSLAVVADGSVDFAFSWDSLVHAGPDALQGYLGELVRTLRPGGAAFLHHSNFAALCKPAEPAPDNPHWRDTATSAELVRELALAVGLQCRSLELVQWGGVQLNDCFTVVRRAVPGDPVPPDTLRYAHPDLSAEMSLARGIDRLYRRGGGAGAMADA